jgi:probable phosphoglycerate mutase
MVGESTIAGVPTVHLVRHGQSTWNVERRLQGQTAHPPLTDLGREQARRAADRLWGIDAPIVSSDLVRARETARIIAAGRPVTLDARLREQALGDLEGRLTRDLVAQPTEGEISEVRWGGGESLQDVYARLADFFAEQRGDLILVTHGDTLRVALALLDGRTHHDVDWRQIPNGAVITRTTGRHDEGPPPRG